MNARAAVQLLKLFGLTYVIAIISAIIVHSLYASSTGQPAETSEAFEAMSQGASFIFIAVILAPVIEELLFRSWLGRVWGVLLVMPLLLAATASFALYGQRAAMPILSTFGALVVLGSLAVYLQRYFNTQHIPNRHEQVVQDLFPYIFWGATVIFALIHVQNHAGAGSPPLLIMLVMPQLIAGSVLGFVRMRFGLLTAIGFHGVYNGVALSLSYLANQAV